MIKKSISYILVLSLVLLSTTSFVFAIDWSTTDQTNLSNIAARLVSGGQSAAYYLQQINSFIRATGTGSLLNKIDSIGSLVLDIKNNGSDAALSAMAIDLQMLYNKVVPNSGNSIGNILENTYRALTVTRGNSDISRLELIEDDVNLLTMYGSSIDSHTYDIEQYLSGWNTNFTTYLSNWLNSNRNMRSVTWDANLIPTFSYSQNNFWGHIIGGFSTIIANSSNQIRYSHALSGVMRSGTFFSGFNMNEVNYDFASTDDLIYKGFRNVSQTLARITSGYGSAQTITNWTTLQTSNVTPQSTTDGLYKYLAAIQTPVARLAYVHASDQDIAAQEASEANQDAVIDNFLDSSGNGAASTSDFTNISSASNGFKTNFNSGASASGIWDVFNSDHGNWFSQSIADSLDTSGSNTRLLKGGSSFDTPLLDQQIEDINKALGVMYDD